MSKIDFPTNSQPKLGATVLTAIITPMQPWIRATQNVLLNKILFAVILLF